MGSTLLEGATTLNIMALGLMALSIPIKNMTLSRTTLSIVYS
jgi:hypothetical protein